jgi:vacuolar-type H+-ATPase subunit H
MTNDRDIEFTPSPTLPQGVDFTPDSGTSSASTGETQHASGAPLDQAREKAQRLVSTAQERASEQVQARFGEQKQRAADSLSSVAQSLRSTTQNLQTDQDGIGRYINEAADRVDNLAHYLHDRELNEIVDQVEDFARRQPVAFLGGAFALGILGARFLKSSQGSMSRHEMRDSYDTRALTSRVEDPERDAIGRPLAPGYAPPSERAPSSGYDAAGPRDI